MLYTVSIPKPCLSYPKTTWHSQNPPNLKRVRLRVSSAALAEANGANVEYTPWLTVGLGNPGNKYHGTRHNVGPLAAYYQVPLRHILLVYDEMSLPNGVLRLQPRGGHGYHNGVKSVIEHLDGRHEFPRFCIGIGDPPGTMDMKAFLLQKFSDTERKEIDKALEQGVDAVRSLISYGFNDRITRFNLGQKYKYNKV